MVQTRKSLLAQLDETATRLLDFYRGLPNPDGMVYELWNAKEVLAHLTFWHESFARNVGDLAQGRKPSPLKGRFIDLNQGGVDALRPYTLAQVLARFDVAHQIIQENIQNPILTLIPYKKGSRDYAPEEHLDLVNKHIQQHLRDVEKAVFTSQRSKVNL